MTKIDPWAPCEIEEIETAIVMIEQGHSIYSVMKSLSKKMSWRSYESIRSKLNRTRMKDPRHNGKDCCAVHRHMRRSK
jgi:hypothetical protein